MRAEFDDALERYFVETEAFSALIEDRVDVVAGDKGTGKTAIYKVIEKRYRQLDQLADVEIVRAFNPSGNPVFQRLVQQEALTEGQYRSVWKAYFFALIGNWALNIAGSDASDRFGRLSEILENPGWKRRQAAKESARSSDEGA